MRGAAPSKPRQAHAACSTALGVHAAGIHGSPRCGSSARWAHTMLAAGRLGSAGELSADRQQPARHRRSNARSSRRERGLASPTSSSGLKVWGLRAPGSWKVAATRAPSSSGPSKPTIKGFQPLAPSRSVSAVSTSHTLAGGAAISMVVSIVRPNMVGACGCAAAGMTWG